MKRWSASAAATLASTYVLDVIASAAGLSLAASGLLDGLNQWQVVVALGLSYAMWALGLSINLGANWDLLEATGTSTSLPSKAAHSLALRWGVAPGRRRAAAGLGYVAAELAKELPYYVAAFGAALATEAVSTREALIFLAGANLGAGAYEFGLARLVRVGLARRGAARYADFAADWAPRDYLAGYYAEVEPDERATIAFLVDALRGVAPGRRVLLFGVGPTVHHVFPVAPYASTIDLGEFLPANLAEIERWIAAAPGAHDWRPFVRHVLDCEGAPTDDATIAGREALTRARIGLRMPVDLRATDPLLGAPAGYDVVITAYCADSATHDRATWAVYMARLAGLVAPGGLFLTAALKEARGYRVGDRVFPSAGVRERDLRGALARRFVDVSVVACGCPDDAGHGYRGVLLGRARLPARIRPAAIAPAPRG